jgi:hypothetical protein
MKSRLPNCALKGSFALILFFTIFYLLFGCVTYPQKPGQTAYEYGKDQVECQDYAERRRVLVIPGSYSAAMQECMEAKGYPKTPL